eukprot:5694407-Ditylum_brightwellii.AAC.1
MEIDQIFTRSCVQAERDILGQGQTSWAQDLEEGKMAHDVIDDDVIVWNLKVLTPRVSSVDSP